MAQLVKLSDYISRYETDIYRYPSRFVRLKKERWERLLHDWEHRKTMPLYQESDDGNLDSDDSSKEAGFLGRLKNFFQREEKNEWDFDMPSQQEAAPPWAAFKSKEELVNHFREEIYRFQLSWASSTISEVSDIKRKYYYDTLLTYLLLKLPDSFFVFYEPVFVAKKAPVDLDIFILTPSELWLITPLFGKKDTIFHADSDRFWIKAQGENKDKIIHPGISLKRMRTVIKTMLEEKELSVPITTAILAKDSYIDTPQTQKRWNYIDRRNIDEWQKALLKNRSPIKHHQLKIADALLSSCLTTSEFRAEYLEDVDEPTEELPK
ncbi:hypothetical protein SAMN05421736_10963 [Evansella caseinilytica]|uniref:NERD domain-containing protein n=1 Tax=Evansella caseinilytica TaxID=1503961 RepID=A0A1H3RUF4_9BACI|nr:hypothetical protein [Evansella caseinilytica]SDZ29326.1 hypothetical protein SAMN05421736_10963 [Evansella caseinilytica]